MSSQLEYFDAMLKARSALVTNYINYIDACSKFLYEKYNTTGTTKELRDKQAMVEALKQMLIQNAEHYSYYFSKYYTMTEKQKHELTERILRDTYLPLVPVPVESIRPHLYPGKPDWLSDPTCKDN